MREPRGHYDMFGGFLLDPTEGGDAAALFMNPSGYTDQCGHGMIAIVTLLIQLGKLPQERYRLKPDLMQVRLETTVGILETEACWNGEKVEFVKFKNTPVWILYKDLTIKSSFGQITGDIVFNGAFNFFAEFDSGQLQVKPENSARIMELGGEIKQTIQSMGLEISNKDFPQITGLHGVDFINLRKKDASDDSKPNQKSVLVFGCKQIDRSPCGSGTAGRVGSLFLKGKISSEHYFVNESIIGSKFKARIVNTTVKANRDSKPACIVEIQGQAHLLGRTEWWLDPDDVIGYNGFIIHR
ncbi:hypothetical protein KL930_004990 [Ogataea haglerorum]|uniref:trans-L-3-hydroxyproline dehydratase n=1 Tax=Ogataea haglerorum TaxID=1937702 RepID=A0AAN6D8V3_9ASCO|nr:uncharacterized protein KL911_004889 [Ogataea haglerorum]KAG7692357.1 hypothetical protein KL915_004788 [Ogataea haglerorum]KAG7699881.1 hypothetical protein KL951_001598 [Ogataea haglerorum]KAG7703281.1 hypothetical protein KL950_004915 [Ogataea haglerorum]KAG7714721.1 hypothetical protein KL949_004557 [Ogataea haglerorum]KAG7715001.1 hypothetical protein KL913_004322 [Ogataea haglerorum]